MTQNFQGINPSLTKPVQHPKVNLVAFIADIIQVPVLRVNDLDDPAICALLSAFACPFYKEKYTGDDCSNADVYRVWCSLYGSLDKEFSLAVANTGLVMADMRVALVEYHSSPSGGCLSTGCSCTLMQKVVSANCLASRSRCLRTLS